MGKEEQPSMKQLGGSYNSPLISRIIRSIIRAILLIITISVLTPIFIPIISFFYFASKPMQKQEFNGMTFYQLMGWEKETFTVMAQEYNQTHPGHKSVEGNCFFSHILIFPISYVISGFYALAGIYPDLQKYINANDLQSGAVIKNVTWPNFLSVWWRNFEYGIWYNIEHSGGFTPIYCRLPIPLPANKTDISK